MREVGAQAAGTVGVAKVAAGRVAVGKVVAGKVEEVMEAATVAAVRAVGKVGVAMAVVKVEDWVVQVKAVVVMTVAEMGVGEREGVATAGEEEEPRAGEVVEAAPVVVIEVVVACSGVEGMQTLAAKPYTLLMATQARCECRCG